MHQSNNGVTIPLADTVPLEAPDADGSQLRSFRIIPLDFRPARHAHGYEFSWLRKSVPR